MRTMIAEDDLNSRQLMERMMSPLGECDVVTDGEKAIKAFRTALAEQRPYDLILLDIMMPNINGQQALVAIREIEKEQGIRGADEVKIIMVTALGDPSTIVRSYSNGATAYITKPIVKEKLMAELYDFGLIDE